MAIYTATITKTKDAEPMGVYTRTSVDDRKDAADFRLTGFLRSKKEIRWRDGRLEYVTERQFEKLCKLHPNWMTDF